MTDPASSEPVERCECGLVPHSPTITGLDAFSCCFARGGNTIARLHCAERTITRLRAELASVQALSEAERAVVNAAVARHELSSGNRPPFAEACIELARSVEALLALRKDQTDGD